MPSRAVYTALALSRSVTGCRTVLIPWVEELVMITPEVVDRIDSPIAQAIDLRLLGVCRRQPSGGFSIPDRSGHLLGHAGRHPRGAVRRVAPVDAGRHADQFGEARAEGAQRRAADLEADLGDAEIAAAQQRHGTLDAPGHQVG